MKVIRTEAAYAKLYQIGKSIQQDSPRRAETFVAELDGTCQQLSATPLAFPLLPNRDNIGTGGAASATT